MITTILPLVCVGRFTPIHHDRVSGIIHRGTYSSMDEIEPILWYSIHTSNVVVVVIVIIYLFAKWDVWVRIAIYIRCKVGKEA